MHGHANTWEEELLETARECAELRAENDEMLTKIVELLDERDELRAENEQLTYLLTLAREEHEQHKAENERLRAVADAARAFVTWHQRGQPGTPDTLYPMTYGALDEWHAEWDRRLQALADAFDESYQAPFATGAGQDL